MDDLQLPQYAVRVQNGDRASFRPIVEQLSKMLIAVAVRYTQNWDNAMDITQETCLKVYSNIDCFDPRYPVRTWIGVIHRTNCISYLRAKRGRKNCADDYALEQRSNRNWTSSNPFSDMVHREFGKRIRNAMKHLSGAQQLSGAILRQNRCIYSLAVYSLFLIESSI